MKKLTLKYFYIFILGISSSAFAQNYSIHFDFMSGYSESLTSSTNIFGGIQPFTVEAWYKNEGVNTGANSGYDDGANIVSSYRRSGGGDPYGNFNFGIHPGDSENSGKGYADHGVKTNERIDDGAWHHLAATYEPNADGSWSFKLYLDGFLNDQNTGPSEGYDHTSSNNNIRMNNHSPFAGDHMLDCSYAGMSITSGLKYIEDFSPQFPLSSNENTIVNLDFSEGDGNQLIDNSGNGNHFNLYGNYQWGSDVPTEPVHGCTDSFAANFNSDATADDGSCSGYPENGEYNLVFDGVYDFVEIDNNSIFTNSGDLTNNFTINLSFKKYDNPQDFEGVNLFSAGDGTVNGKRLSVYINNDNTIIVPLEGNDWITNHVISENIWTDLSLTYLNGIMKLYINGFLVDETNQYTVSIDTSSPLRIGSNTMSREDEFFHGHIDNVVIWNRYLSESEIEYFTFGVDSLLSFDGIVASYSFNSGNGDIVYDRSGGQSHGDINGANWSLPATPGENNSLSFDGDYDFVELADLGDPINAMTVQFWLKKSVNSDVAFIMGQRGWSSQYLHFDVTDDNTSQKIHFNING